MTKMKEPGLFDMPPAVPAPLPPATVEAMREIVSDGQRMWIATLLLSVLTGKRSLDALRETLGHEKLPADLITRLVDPMIPRIGATP